jgi:hypothetical protein
VPFRDWFWNGAFSMPVAALFAGVITSGLPVNRPEPVGKHSNRDRTAQAYFFKPAVQFTTTLMAWVDSPTSIFVITRPSGAISHAAP